MNTTENLTYQADVLVIGGGPAGTWAAFTAASKGVKVILVDKGYCGSSGATASAGTELWFVPGTQQQAQAIRGKEALGGYLSDREWQQRLLDHTLWYSRRLGELGYPFPLDSHGRPYRGSLQGPEYMRLMRSLIKKAGVRILDHSPALGLLADDEGVGGAYGVRTQKNSGWEIRAGAVILATGGCAFLSKSLGCNVLTGDGYLMAAEVGADFSGMEFSCEYGMSASFASVTKNFFYNWATFYFEDEQALPNNERSTIARALLTQPVFAKLDRTSEKLRAAMRKSQPNFFLPFDRRGIDPFTQPFPITLRLEGTVRGSGGINIVDEDCATRVSGLYAVGDAATRELVCGGASGGGSINASWAMASGCWAGSAATEYARRSGMRSKLNGMLHRSESTTASAYQLSGADLDAIVRAVQDEVLPYDKNLFRSGHRLQGSLDRLDQLWTDMQYGMVDRTNSLLQLRARQTSAMIATARWMYTSALNRRESRALHVREDYPSLSPQFRHRLLTGGLQEIWTVPHHGNQLKGEEVFQ